MNNLEVLNLACELHQQTDKLVRGIEELAGTGALDMPLTASLKLSALVMAAKHELQRSGRVFFEATVDGLRAETRMLGACSSVEGEPVPVNDASTNTEGP